MPINDNWGVATWIIADFHGSIKELAAFWLKSKYHARDDLRSLLTSRRLRITLKALGSSADWGGCFHANSGSAADSNAKWCFCFGFLRVLKFVLGFPAGPLGSCTFSWIIPCWFACSAASPPDRRTPRRSRCYRATRLPTSRPVHLWSQWGCRHSGRNNFRKITRVSPTD